MEDTCFVQCKEKSAVLKILSPFMSSLSTHFMQLVFFYNPEKIRKPEDFLYFQGMQKETSDLKWVRHQEKWECLYACFV